VRAPPVKLVFHDVKVPKEKIYCLAKADWGAPMMCLDSARYGIAWGAIGAAMDCYDSARDTLLKEFNLENQLAHFSLIQKKLAEMLSEITKAQLLNWRWVC